MMKSQDRCQCTTIYCIVLRREISQLSVQMIILTERRRRSRIGSKRLIRLNMFLKFENICQSPTSTQHNLNCRWALDENDFAHYHHPTPPTHRPGTLLQIRRDKRQCKPNLRQLYVTISDYIRLCYTTILDCLTQLS